MEIKFRGKDLDSGEWVYGYYFYSESSEKGYILGEPVRIQECQDQLINKRDEEKEDKRLWK